MKRSEERPLAPKDVDVAAESGRRFVGAYVEISTQRVKLIRVERPRIALRREDWRPRGIQRSQGMHEWRVAFRFRKMIEVVRILAQVDESPVARAVRRIRPRHHQDRIVCRTFNRPFRKHHQPS
jgi:hypothetical protein